MIHCFHQSLCLFNLWHSHSQYTDLYCDAWSLTTVFQPMTFPLSIYRFILWCLILNDSITTVFQVHTVYVLFLPLAPSLLNLKQFLNNCVHQKKYLFLTAHKWFQDGTKLFCKCRGLKITWGENNTVPCAGSLKN